MNLLRRWSVIILLLAPVALLAVVRGHEPAAPERKADQKPAEKWLVDRSLTVTPVAAPVPALKYRLYPMISDRKDGNAVPIYLRFAHERGDARKKELWENVEKWNELPLDKLPLADVKAFLDGYKYNLRQLELGAWRKTADWNYTLDAGDPIGILLPDAQEMRMHARLLVLKARAEIAEKRYADALHTLETGFSFSQQISDSPFLISDLVGIASASVLSDCLLELIERPDAPSLYWALAVIPRPLIDLRRGNEFEQKLAEMQFPELADLDRPRSPKEWDAVFSRIHTALKRIIDGMTLSEGLAADGANPSGVTKPGEKPSVPPPPDLAAMRKYLAEVFGMAPQRLKEMSPSELRLRYMLSIYKELRDEVFKASYLPFPEARPLFAAVDKRLKSAIASDPVQLYQFLPALLKVHLAQIRLERKLAAVRAIEALRIYAAAHGGQFPDRLDQVTMAPVPNDPGTGQPFEYQRTGQTATLSSRIPGEPLSTTGLRYRVTLRK